jgi:hypothetical protein
MDRRGSSNFGLSSRQFFAPSIAEGAEGKASFLKKDVIFFELGRAGFAATGWLAAPPIAPI